MYDKFVVSITQDVKLTGFGEEGVGLAAGRDFKVFLLGEFTVSPKSSLLRSRMQFMQKLDCKTSLNS